MKLKFIKLAIFSRLHVLYDHAQMNYRVNRALLMETCQREIILFFLTQYLLIFPLCTKLQEKVILTVGESGRLF